jgi:tripartite-type tricarboxylate transporter receptor subunit TctC
MQRATAFSRRRFCAALAAAIAAAITTLPRASYAQADYPNRAIRIVVPYAAGGSTDLVARVVAAELQKTLGHTVLIENRPGASGNVGTVVVARAQPDGYTLLLNTSSFMANASLFKPAPYDPIREFEPIADIASSPTAIAANVNAGINTVGDMIAQAKADPQKLNYGTGGPGSMPHLTIELLKLKAGVNLTHVPFGGGGPAMQATLAGTIQLTAGNLGNMMGQLESGALKGVALTSAKRWPELPNVPTLVESGYPDFVMEGTHVLVAPAGTPKAIIDRLGKATVEAVRRPEVSSKFRQAGLEVIAGGPAELKARIAKEVPEFRDLIVRVGIPAR